MCEGKEVVFQFASNMGGMLWISSHHADVMIDNSLININMLRASQQAGVQEYYFSSSACVYNVDLQTSEDVIALRESDAYPALPNESYGWEKLYCEQLCLAMQQDLKMNIRIGRFHNVYGEMFTCFDKDKGKAPCHLILKAIRHPNPPMELWGDGRATRSFLYIDDCVEAVLRLMDSDYDQPINIGSDRLISVDELANIIIKISGKDIAPTHDLSKPQGVRGRNSDNTLVNEVLNWQPQVSLEEGLEKVYKWAVEHYDELENI
jgi:nucleoside-diphosphate-sugar epimerase